MSRKVPVRRNRIRKSTRKTFSENYLNSCVAEKDREIEQLEQQITQLKQELAEVKDRNSAQDHALGLALINKQEAEKQHARAETLTTKNKSLVEVLEFYGDAEKLAERFHTTYETFAPSVGYKTRIESRVAWQAVPDANKKLMIKVAESIGEKARAAIEANGGE